MIPSTQTAVVSSGFSKAGPADEAAIIEACRRGDRHAWDLLFKHYQGELHGFAYSLCRNHEDSADIVSQSFLSAYRNIHHLRSAGSLPSWLHTIVRHVHIDMLRRSHGLMDQSLDESLRCEGNGRIPIAADASTEPETSLLRTIRNETLLRAISHIPLYQRQIVEQHYYLGIPYRDLAKRNRLSEGTVKSRLSRARRFLRERLAQDEELLTTAWNG